MDDVWESLRTKSKACQRGLVKWHKKEFKRADDEIFKLKQRLSVLVNQDDQFCKWDDMQDIKKRIADLWLQEEKFWCQRSRVKWLKWGDKNSSFFHASTIQRRGKNRIQRLQDDQGEWIEGRDGIFSHILHHFSEVYRSDGSRNWQECIQNIPRLVSSDMNNSLMSSVSSVEIKAAVDELGALKAPGPDGFNGLFYQKHWEVVKDSVSAAVKCFFADGILPETINETLVTLIPKVSLPDNLNQLRPISCCNFLYKIISKLIVRRLKGMMGSLISPNQSAFVGGRLIQDNLVIAQEVFHSLKRRNKGGKENIAIKLDMNKAYDRLEWGFLEKVLLAFGFCVEWVALIMKMVSSVTYRYKVNGFTSRKLVPHRGLRQGDPLSPYLFILAADALSLMLNKALDEGKIQGIQLGSGAPVLTHSFFADDALLYVKASPDNLYQVVNILNVYTAASGQKINLTKSGVVCGKFMNADLKHRLADILHMQIWEDPGKYLGLPADWGISKCSALAWIKERILAKIAGWKENLLNQAGKEVLIKAVLQAIPNYTMSIVRFPKNFCQNICSSIARFWWSSYGKARGIHWKSWAALTAGKWEGGLGFKDFSDLNSSLLAKQAWRIFDNPEALWVKVLKGCYFPNSGFAQARRKRGDSWAWTSILHGRDVILKSARWLVGDGETVNIQEDRWLASGEIIEGQRGVQVTRVRELIDGNNKSWNLNRIRHHFDPGITKKILETPIRRTTGQDLLCWPPSKSGEFSVKSGYYEVRKNRMEPTATASSSVCVDGAFWKEIWGACVPQKIKIFIWKVCHNILPLRDNLWKKKVVQSKICPICQSEDETIEHALLLCDWTRPVWHGSQLQMVIQKEGLSSIQNWLEGRLLQFQIQPEFKSYRIMVLFCSLWNIWKSRNLAWFEGKPPDPMTTMIQINGLCSDYASLLKETPIPRSANSEDTSRVGKFWRPPVRGGFKINYDASYNRISRSGHAGIVVRGESGEFITGLSSQICANSPLVAEALALREAVFLASNLGMENVVFEGDNLDLTKACRNEIIRRDIINILQDVWVSKQSFSRCGFTWVSRQGNKVAHLAAALADKGDLPFNWSVVLPAPLKAAVQVDVQASNALLG